LALKLARAYNIIRGVVVVVVVVVVIAFWTCCNWLGISPLHWRVPTIKEYLT
jgi:hypothetical protein